MRNCGLKYALIHCLSVLIDSSDTGSLKISLWKTSPVIMTRSSHKMNISKTLSKEENQYVESWKISSWKQPKRIIKNVLCTSKYLQLLETSWVLILINDHFWWHSSEKIQKSQCSDLHINQLPKSPLHSVNTLSYLNIGIKMAYFYFMHIWYSFSLMITSCLSINLQVACMTILSE